MMALGRRHFTQGKRSFWGAFDRLEARSVGDARFSDLDCTRSGDHVRVVLNGLLRKG